MAAGRTRESALRELAEVDEGHKVQGQGSCAPLRSRPVISPVAAPPLGAPDRASVMED